MIIELLALGSDHKRQGMLEKPMAKKMMEEPASARNTGQERVPQRNRMKPLIKHRYPQANPAQIGLLLMMAMEVSKQRTDVKGPCDTCHTRPGHLRHGIGMAKIGVRQAQLTFVRPPSRAIAMIPVALGIHCMSSSVFDPAFATVDAAPSSKRCVAKKGFADTIVRSFMLHAVRSTW
mmetsp:Transcript_74534/g.207093  ORF Transcript_74534/g.207093 Transcript_74534/m.207093 type:complete len:177 (-) Transcript_74534:1140-1670(-)